MLRYSPTTFALELDQLRQVADEMDVGAKTAPCSEAEVVRDAADEIERLDALVFYQNTRGWPAYTAADREHLGRRPDPLVQSRAMRRHMKVVTRVTYNTQADTGDALKRLLMAADTLCSSARNLTREADLQAVRLALAEYRFLSGQEETIL